MGSPSKVAGSDTRHHRYWSCERKLALKPNVAAAVARDIRRACEHVEDWRVVAYPCPYGDHWHVGHVEWTSDKAKNLAKIRVRGKQEKRPRAKRKYAAKFQRLRPGAASQGDRP
jgi:hypothetical protein